jgi:hypothetical protein
MKNILLSLLSLVAVVGAAEPEVTAKREGSQLVIRAGEKEILRYQAEPGELPEGVREAYRRGGYIQSIFTPAGSLITDDFPANHRHHHGVWSPWTRAEFRGRQTDFWNMGDEKGRVEFVALDEVWEKVGKAGFKARHQFVDLTARRPEVALLETWEVSAWPEGDSFVIDFTSTQKCATRHPLKLPEYHYGGFGFRGSREWDGARNLQLLASSGKTNRQEINTSRERWCWIGGTVEGNLCGVIILCHPENFRFQQPVRAHPDEPFFCYAPQQLGDMEIAPDDTYVARYRLVVSDGKPTAEDAEAHWKKLE